MYYASESGWQAADAERAFVRAVRARRRASLTRRVLHRCAACARLAIHEVCALQRPAGRGAVREIPVAAITGTVEPNRAAQFDSDFRPSPLARRRWLSIWLAEQRGASLPPISVAAVGDAYAVLDGHHRVSVARARGVETIAASVS